MKKYFFRSIFLVLFCFLCIKAIQTYHHSNEASRPLTVDFLVLSAYEIDHFAPICKELINRGIQARLVIPPRPQWMFAKIQHLLEKKIPYLRAINKRAPLEKMAEIREVPYTQSLDEYATCSIGTQKPYCFKSCQGIKLKMGYGVGLLAYDNVHRQELYLNGFDGFLVHGPLEYNAYSPYFDKDRVHIIGTPKYDAFFSNKPDKDFLRKQLGILPEDKRKIIAYLPTWCNNKSIHIFQKELEYLSQEYIVLIKPHPHTQLNHPEDMDVLRKLSPYLIDAKLSLLDAAYLADLIVADAKSGATTEAFLVTEGKTPMIALYPQDKMNLIPEALSAFPLFKNPDGFLEAVQSLLQEDTYLEGRTQLLSHCYCNNYGKGSQKAADSILYFSKITPCHNMDFGPSKLERSIKKRLQAIKCIFSK